MIGQLCNEAGVELAFPVLENAQVWAALPNTPEVNYFLSGGVKFKGSPFMGFYNSTMPAAQGPTLPIDQFSESFLPFGKFKREKRIWFEGEAFSREEIILFVANKLGGVHYDGRRDLRQEKLERASRFMTFGGPIDHEPPGQVHLAVEPKATEILSGLHVEIISAAASFINLHIDGAPLVSFTVKRTIFESIARLLKPKPGIKLIDRA
ncbi:hypothetical protein NA8A_22411 [Nitratireductor indicus C115]|uniref:Uncharacterized protein n=2 Tax=Nitratireductor indicus TaxID=721133 RepID=K2NYI2_9HYPH|nr:hypothetical protein NA8A_22411 [Nitratireductor indicus C115]